jgi:hypothetical protein
MSQSLDDYRRDVRRDGLLSSRENLPQFVEWLVTEVAWHRLKDDLDSKWDDQRYREALAKSAYMEGAEGRLARRESVTIKEENAHV